MNPVSLALAPGDLAAILPEIVLTLGGALLMLGGAFLPGSRRAWPLLSILVLGVAWMTGPQLPLASPNIFSGAMEVTAFTRFADGFLYLATALALACAGSYFERDRQGHGEVYALILWTTLGLSVMAKSLDLVLLFLGLELMSVCLYVLAGYYRDVAASSEAALKYFVTGSFASAILLYGIAMIFGKSGSTSLADAVRWLAGEGGVSRADGLVALGFFLIIVGVAFKLGVAPFHAWVPDVYTGSPTPVSAFMSVAPKWAAFAVLARIVRSASVVGAPGRWAGLIAILAILSIAFGNLAALAQRDVKRMLAYSGIAHMGYVSIAFVVLGPDALTGVLVYSLAYAFANIGAFAVSAAVTRGEDQPHPINDLAGLAKTRPMHALAMLIFMISLAGVPPTAGFAGKFLVFRAAVEGGWVSLALVGIAGSLVSAAFYLRVVHTMYVREPSADPPETRTDWLAGLGVVGACAGTLAVGILPGPAAEAAMRAALALLGK